MNVEQIQKINNLALDLMKQGLVSDRAEAIAQAEKVFQNNRGVKEYTSIKKTLDEVQAEALSEKKKIFGNDDEDLSSEKVKDILGQNTRFIVKKMNEFQEKIISLEKEISSLKNELRYQKLPTVNQIIPDKAAPKGQTLNEISAVKEEEEKKIHPRSGNYKTEDVSIEKFFYMGNN